MPSVLTREENSKKFTKEMILCVIQLMGECEVSGKNCGRVIETVSRHLFKVDIDRSELPSERTSLRFADQGHVLAKQQIGEALRKSANVDLHSDGTTRDHNKIVGHQFSTEMGLLSCGFVPVAKEDTETLLDISFSLLKELSEILDDEEAADQQFKSMLQNISGLMSDRASVMKSYQKSFNKTRKEILSTEEDLEFLHCNAHFLLGLSTEADKVLKGLERDSGKIGRDKCEKFARFTTSSETSASRFIRTASDILAPRGDEKNGCRDSWEAFCEMQGFTSTLQSFRGNRFNNFFHAAASIHHHNSSLVDFLTNYMSPLNLKQESVLMDAKCKTVDSLMVSLGIMYHKVTGPYWRLIQQDIKYLDFHKYVGEMDNMLQKWSNDAHELTADNTPPLFGVQMDVQMDATMLPSLYNLPESQTAEVIPILEKLCSAFREVIGRQLTDFLPGGRYHQVTNNVTSERLKNSKITNLVAEECFGDLDFSLFKRRNASIHHHSTINMLKRNNTLAWFDAKTADEKKDILDICSTKSSLMREKHQSQQATVLQKRKEQLERNKHKMEKKIADLCLKKTEISKKVKKHGGPCLFPKDVFNLLKECTTEKERTSLLRDELRFQKLVLGAKGPLLKLSGPSDVLASNLKLFLDGSTIPASQELLNVDSETETESDSDSELDATNTDSSKFGQFCFSKQGQNVAVFYDNDFYIGQVVCVLSADEGDVKFMEKCRVLDNKYKWPLTDNVEKVESVYVFDWDFESTTRNGRIWEIAGAGVHDEVRKKYELYKELYC